MRTQILAVMTALVTMCGLSLGVTAQQPDLRNPTVPLVKAVGCVEMEEGSWFLTRATEAERTNAPFANEAEVEEARAASLGSNRFLLIGVADFLDTNGLLALHQRSEFTAEESVNATGQLAAGRKVAVKGLHITSIDPPRLNLTSVISLAESCS